MELRGGSRNGAVHRPFDNDSPATMDEIPIMDDIPPGPGSPSPPSTPGHQRGKSEHQNLLPTTSRNLFHYSTSREFRYDQPEDEAGEGRDSPIWKGVARSLIRTRKQKWRDLVIDFIAIAVGLPFFALVGAMIRLDGMPVRGHQENILTQCIKGVSTTISMKLCKLIGWRLQLYFLSFSLSSLAEPWSKSHHGKLNEDRQWAC